MLTTMKRLLLGFLLFAVGGTVQARLSIEITGGMEGALPIAVVPFGWTGKAAQPPEDIAAIVAADLRRSGRFAPLSEEQFPGRPHEGSEVSFPGWRATGSENLVVGRVEAVGNIFKVEFQLFDVVRGEQLAGYSIRTQPGTLRRIAHQISDIVYEKLTGDRGAFDTHIAYVTVVPGPDGERRFRLAVADADGYNEQVILTSSKPLMSPAWSPDGLRLAYVSFEEGRSAVYVQYVRTGKRERVASHEGINSAPAWSPDGNRLALTLSRDGNPEIYVLDLRSGDLRRLTDNYAIDTSPAWSPDGDALVFTSDRGGRPQVYRIKVGDSGADGTPQRLTFEGTYNARAGYSPDGRYLTLLHGDGSSFRVGVLDLETGGLRVLTDTRLDESPSFAPNGSMIIYATEVDNRGVLEVVSVDGGVHQRLVLQQGDVREPAWSPLIQ